MLNIRYIRVGKKNSAFFKIVVTDKRRSAKSGKFLEELGYYNPKTKERKLNIERVKHWLSQGATVSDTVHNALVAEKLIDAKKKASHKQPKKKEGEETK